MAEALSGIERARAKAPRLAGLSTGPPLVPYHASDRGMKGPYPIICRGHSGSRLLAEAFLRNRFWMGLSDNKTRDSKEFKRKSSALRKLTLASPGYRDLPEERKVDLQRTMRRLAERSRNRCPDPEARIAHGWKRDLTTFTVDVLLDACPNAKVVHLFRDGRDVMLSRLKRLRKVHDPVVRLMTFGDADVAEYDGRPLTAELVEERRAEIEMVHWVTSVRFGMRGRAYPDRYLEVRYEELCRQLVETLSGVFDFLGVPFLPGTREWISGAAFTRKIGKWRHVETDEGANAAIAIGEPLLRELGYWQGWGPDTG